MQLIDLGYYKHICERYGVTVDAAIALGTRANGRRPDLPGSSTCAPVVGMTHEEIWDMRDRSTEESVFQFYEDQGAWSTFRQVVRHSGLTQLHLNLLGPLLRGGSHVCEYGCGVAPFSASLLQNITGSDRMGLMVSLSDVQSEHFRFGAWRLERIINDRQLHDVMLSVKPVTVDALPKYDAPIDVAIIFEVLEHVPSPVATVLNMLEQMAPGGYIIENFIKHERHENDASGPNLDSAANERDAFYAILDERMELALGGPPVEHPNMTRVWRMRQ